MKSQGSQYLNEQRRSYALYTLQHRAIPAVTDGLKPSSRRVLWTARNGQKIKAASLAGATMPIHPHSAPEGAINTLAAPYGNNIPLLTGIGAFGTLLEPNAYGASRYTSVYTSKFTNDVVFADLNIVPLTENYDSTTLEPIHFLPLIPLVLLNPAEGIAVGFSTNILPRTLNDIISAQINILKGLKITTPLIPTFVPLQNRSHISEETDKGIMYYFNGEYENINVTTIKITKLPYGQSHEKVISKLEAECDKGTVIDYTDNSRDIIDIEVKFKKGVLKTLSTDDVLKMFGLTIRHTENLNVLNFSGNSILNTSAEKLIEDFTNWRLTFYINRYEKLKEVLLVNLQKYYDVRTAILKKVGGKAHSVSSKSELKQYIEQLKIVNVDYIAELPVYRFTEQERLKNEECISEAEKTLEYYNLVLSSEKERKKIYINELQQILTNFFKNKYSTVGVVG